MSTHGVSRSFLIGWWFIAVVCSGCGLAVLWLISQIGHGFEYKGDVSSLSAIAFGLIALGPVIAFVSWWLAASQPKFYLHENAIRAVDRQGDRLDFYEDIEDLYVFLYGGLGYRASPDAPWKFVGARISGYGRLCQQLRSLHAERRSERLYGAVMSGERAVFRCLSDSVAFSKSMVASRNLNYPTYELEVTSSRLSVKGKAIEIGRIADIKENGWSERAGIVDSEGKVFHAMHLTSVLSMDVLYALLARLQQNQAGLRNR